MLGSYGENIGNLGYPKIAKNSPKWPQLACKGSNKIVETTVTPKTGVK